MRKPLVWALLTATFGCPPAPSTGPSEKGPPHAAAQAPEAHRTFVRIRALLGEDPQSPARAEHLYPLVVSVCSDPGERERFVESFAWSVSFATEEATLVEQLALDVLEHVSTSCARTDPEAAMELLTLAQPHVKHDRARLQILRARLAAVTGDLERAESAAKAAVEAGSIHAIALLANVRARIAREAGVGYRTGMLDAAIETTEVEPTAKWQAIDLAAVLSTRARLLNEKAFWLPPDEREGALERAHRAFARLSVAPFLAATRIPALDQRCFDAPRMPGERVACQTAADEFGVLGAARLLGRDPGELSEADPERARHLDQARELLAGSGAEDLGVVVFRGDETELLEWGRPTATLLGSLPRMQWLVLDRTGGDRGRAVVDRVLQLAGIRPDFRLRVGRDARAIPCAAALVSGRTAPPRCPLEAADRQTLTRLPSPRFAVLIGRDLDAEVADFELYDVPTVLLSLRRSQVPQKVSAWLKSVSDVWWLVDPEAEDGLR